MPRLCFDTAHARLSFVWRTDAHASRNNRVCVGPVQWRADCECDAHAMAMRPAAAGSSFLSLSLGAHSRTTVLHYLRATTHSHSLFGVTAASRRARFPLLTIACIFNYLSSAPRRSHCSARRRSPRLASPAGVRARHLASALALLAAVSRPADAPPTSNPIFGRFPSHMALFPFQIPIPHGFANDAGRRILIVYASTSSARARAACCAEGVLRGERRGSAALACCARNGNDAMTG